MQSALLPLRRLRFLLFALLLAGDLLSATAVAALSMRSPYVGDVKKSLMTHIPLYDKAGNLLGSNWWEPKFRTPMDDTTDADPYGFNPYARHKTEWMDSRFNPATMKIPGLEESPMTWPVPIVQGKPGVTLHPNRRDEQEVAAATFHPNESGCSRKGMMPCGWGIYKLPLMVLHDGKKYCCPQPPPADGSQEHQAPQRNNPVGNFLRNVAPGCSSFSDSAQACCQQVNCGFSGLSCLTRDAIANNGNEDKCGAPGLR